MYPSIDNAHPQSDLVNDAKGRRKLLDQKRMEYRRAIEEFAEQRRLQLELADYPDLIAVGYISAATAGPPRSARPAR